MIRQSGLFGAFLLIIFCNSGYSKQPPLKKEDQKTNLILLNPIRDKAKEFRGYLEFLKKLLEQQEKESLSDKIDALMKEAEEKTIALENASTQHDQLMLQYQQGKYNSGKEAVELAEAILATQEAGLKDLILQLKSLVQPSLNDSLDLSLQKEISQKTDHHDFVPVQSLPPSQKSPPASSTKFRDFTLEEEPRYTLLSDGDLEDRLPS